MPEGLVLDSDEGKNDITEPVTVGSTEQTVGVPVDTNGGNGGAQKPKDLTMAAMTESKITTTEADNVKLEGGQEDSPFIVSDSPNDKGVGQIKQDVSELGSNEEEEILQMIDEEDADVSYELIQNEES